MNLKDDLVDDCCCGKTVTTPFCPYCGKEFNGHSLWTLLSHCRISLAQSSKNTEQYDDSSWGSRAVRAKKAAAKWARWVSLLEEVLDQQQIADRDMAKKERA